MYISIIDVWFRLCMRFVIFLVFDVGLCVVWIKWLYLFKDNEFGIRSDIIGILVFLLIVVRSFVFCNDCELIIIFMFVFLIRFVIVKFMNN